MFLHFPWGVGLKGRRNCQCRVLDLFRMMVLATRMFLMGTDRVFWGSLDVFHRTEIKWFVVM